MKPEGMNKVLNVGAWSEQAACRETDPDEMFVQGAAQNRVKQICSGCPVRMECLADALDNHIELIVIPRLRARLGLLGTISRIAPMLGLLGTVSGMIGAFSTIAGSTGAGVEPAALAGDIGMALGTTFLGLLVAIPVVFAVTYVKARIEKLEVDLDRYSQKCLDILFPSAQPSIVPAPQSGALA